MREVCVALGIAMRTDETWCGDIVTAAVSRLAHFTPPPLLFSTTDLNS